jgi:hypothetical protein
VALDGLFAFEGHELGDLLCGPEQVHWDRASLKQLLKPVGDFWLPAAEAAAEAAGEAPPAGEGAGEAAADGQGGKKGGKPGKKKAKGGSSGSGGGVDTLAWLRAWLVALPQPGRLTFLELVTGQRALLPDLVVHVRRTQSSSQSAAKCAQLPYFHSCTSTLDLPRFSSEAALQEAMATAVANGAAGGFSEVAGAST